MTMQALKIAAVLGPRLWLVLVLVALVGCRGSDWPSPADFERVGEDAEPLPRGPDVMVDFVPLDPDRKPFADFNVLVDGAELGRMRQSPSEDIELNVRVEVGTRIFEGVTLQLHGGLARTFSKKSYRLTFPDDDEVPIDLFEDRPEDEYRRLVFLASYIDPSFLGNRLTMDVVRQAGGLAPHMGYATLSFNGQVAGFYVVSERIDRQFLTREGLDRSGNVYKAVNHNANWAAKADPMVGFEHKLGDGPTDDLGWLLETVTGTPTTHDDFVRDVEAALSLDDFMAFGIAHTFAGNRDTHTKNYYLYHDLDADPGELEDRFRIISWDADATFGLDWDGALLAERDLAWHGTDRFSPRLYSIPHYRTKYVERYKIALNSYLSAEELAVRVEALVASIRLYVFADLAMWRPDRDFDVELDRIDAWIMQRPSEMAEVLEGL